VIFADKLLIIADKMNTSSDKFTRIAINIKNIKETLSIARKRSLINSRKTRKTSYT